MDIVRAAKCGNISIVKEILQERDKNEYHCYDYNLAMSEAAKYGYMDIIQLMVQEGANYYDWSMIEAAGNGYIDIVQYIIREGLKNAFDFSKNDYNWAMAYASYGGHMEIIQLMLQKGADVSRLNKITKEKLNKIYKIENDLFKSILEHIINDTNFVYEIGNYWKTEILED